MTLERTIDSEFPGWGVASSKNERGLVPLQYLMEQDRIMPERAPVQGREVNRFTAFVTSGVETYLVSEGVRGSESSDCRGFYHITDGPTWQSSINAFEVSVGPTHVVGTPQYVFYELKTTFSDSSAVIVVERRYSQFQALHYALQREFPLIVLPQLPAKSIHNMDPIFIEGRKAGLQHYMNRLVRHPIIRGCDLMTTFLASEDGRVECRGCAFDKVMHPDFNHDDGDSAKVEELLRVIESTSAHISEILRNLKTLDSSRVETAKRTQAVSMSIASLAMDTPEKDVGDGLLHLSARLTSDEPVFDAARLEEWAHITEECRSLGAIHAATRNLQTRNPANDSVEAKCDTIFNVILAELHHIDQQRVEDVQYLMELQDAQIQWHEKELAKLRAPMTALSFASRRLLMQDLHKEVPSSSMLGRLRAMW